MAGSISITEGSQAAFRAIGRTWRPAFGALCLAGLLATAASAAVVLRMSGMLPSLYAAYLVATVMAQGALFRVVGAGGVAEGPGAGLGWAGFQWSRLETRLLAVALLRIVLFSVLSALLLTLVAAVYVGVASARSSHGVADAAHWGHLDDPVISAAVSIVALFGFIGLGWVGLRLYLAPAATVALGRVQLLSTWGLTRGQVWRIAGMLILALSPMILTVLAVRAGRVLLSIRFDMLRTDAVIVSLILGFGRAFLALPASVGLMSYLHHRLGPDDAGAP